MKRSVKLAILLPLAVAVLHCPWQNQSCSVY